MCEPPMRHFFFGGNPWLALAFLLGVGGSKYFATTGRRKLLRVHIIAAFCMSVQWCA